MALKKIVVAMVNYLYEALCGYFTRLCHVGYMKQSEVEKLVVLTSIQRMVDCDFRGYLDEEAYNKINDVLYNLYGTTCLIPYPDYYSNKDKRIMYTCSISELASRVQRLEEIGPGGSGVDIDTLQQLVDESVGTAMSEVTGKDIVIPEDDEENYTIIEDIEDSN